ncbi:hypothetical protein R69746_08761 [Paraburkholderia aspalathi]|nr:hypothetical protein R75465_08450 [Paraburkholderia aspalathi]CAE6875667.1 hypothetical protein R69746_08761 [Paraburkholderia aspalathi]
MSGADSPAHISMPGVHRVSALLKRWLPGTHHGAVKPLQLDHYLDEFVFRFNRRTSRSRGQLFYRLLEQAVAVEPVTYHQIAQRPPKADVARDARKTAADGDRRRRTSARDAASNELAKAHVRTEAQAEQMSRAHAEPGRGAQDRRSIREAGAKLASQLEATQAQNAAAAGCDEGGGRRSRQAGQGAGSARRSEKSVS